MAELLDLAKVVSSAPGEAAPICMRPLAKGCFHSKIFPDNFFFEKMGSRRGGVAAQHLLNSYWRKVIGLDRS